MAVEVAAETVGKAGRSVDVAQVALAAAAAAAAVAAAVQVVVTVGLGTARALVWALVWEYHPLL